MKRTCLIHTQMRMNWSEAEISEANIQLRVPYGIKKANLIWMKYFSVIVFVLFEFSAFAQWECRSHLAANLKPLYKGAELKWGAEIVGTEGYLTNSNIASGMSFLGLDYTTGNHQFYVEGGLKYWRSKDLDTDYLFTKNMFGLRELSYSYSTPEIEARLGFHQMDAGDFFLVNERAWGTSIDKKIGATSLKLNVATVTKDFARNGIFCTNGYLYDIVPTRNYTLGNHFGDTNFASLSLKKTIGSKAEKSDFKEDNDGFEDFGAIDETSSGKRSFLKSYGGILYTEFGNFYTKPQSYAGFTAEFNLSKLSGLKAEGIYQQVADNRAFITYLQYEKTMDWKSGNLSTIQLFFLGKLDLDDGALAMPRFSNLFLGEVFRMDAIDMPLLNLSAKHQFTNQQLSLKLQYTRQIENLQMQELDFSVGKFLMKKHLRLTALTGVMKSTELDDWAKMARMEMRFYF